MFKRFPKIIGWALIVLTASLILLAGWSQTADEQAQASSTAEPPADVLKTANPDPEEPAEGSEPAADSLIESTAPAPSGRTAKWVKTFENLVDGIEKGSLGREDADKFYRELNAALRDKSDRLREALTSLTSAYSQPDKAAHKKSPAGPAAKTPEQQESREKALPEKEAESRAQGSHNAEQLKLDLTVLYNLRAQVLEKVSPQLRSRINGTGIDGVEAFKEELDYILLKFRYHLYTLPSMGRRALNGVLSAPIPVLLAIIQLAVAALAFLWWRRWAREGILKLRSNFLHARPQKSSNIWPANFLWYLNRVRRPLEWGLLLFILFNIIDLSEGKLIQSFLWKEASWILMAWFAVALVDAMSARRAVDSKSNIAGLRKRSIWLLAVWVLLVTMGLGIIESLTGRGTIYEWMRDFSKLLLVPVVLLIIVWWRPEIFRKLEETSQQAAYIRKILQHRRGIRSYFGAALGGAYLIVNHVRQWVLRGITAFEGGRSLVANLTRLEAMRVSERQQLKSLGEPISEEMRQGLFADDGKLVESVGDSCLERMLQLVEQRRRGTAAIVAERGGGKTQLLRRLDSRLDDKTMLFSCPFGGFEEFQKVFAESLGLNVTDLTPETISARLEETRISVIGIDNLDRLSRPTIGGQQDMDKLAALVRSLQVNVFWFFGVNWTAWQYISSVRADRLFLDEILKLPLWTEEQIRMLIELRSSCAGIVPDFRELNLPRQFEDISYETVEERNRFGFYRILWNTSDGNPVVALQLWADSLRVAADGRMLVSLPQLPATGELEKVQIDVLLTLRVIAQSGMATQDEIIASLRFPAAEIAGALRLAIDKEWVESVNGRYHITWKWFRSITRVLARQNMLVRRTLGG